MTPDIPADLTIMLAAECGAEGMGHGTERKAPVHAAAMGHAAHPGSDQVWDFLAGLPEANDKNKSDIIQFQHILRVVPDVTLGVQADYGLAVLNLYEDFRGTNRDWWIEKLGRTGTSRSALSTLNSRTEMSAKKTRWKTGLPSALASLLATACRVIPSLLHPARPGDA